MTDANGAAGYHAGAARIGEGNIAPRSLVTGRKELSLLIRLTTAFEKPGSFWAYIVQEELAWLVQSMKTVAQGPCAGKPGRQKELKNEITGQSPADHTGPCHLLRVENHSVIGGSGIAGEKFRGTKLVTGKGVPI